MKKKYRWIVYTAVSLAAFFLISVVGMAAYYYLVARNTLEQVTTPENPYTVLSVYVLQDDPASDIRDTAGYPYGISTKDDSIAKEQLLVKLEEILGEKPTVTAYENLFTLVDGLRDQQCRSIVLNEAYVQSIAETEGYEWITEGMRRIGYFSLSDVSESEEQLPVPDKVPESFLVYLSGIDTFGGLAARSRSDVNILMAVNTRTDEILLVSTPRDYYVEFSETGGAKDKLTHAGIYGIDASVDALERLYDVSIDYYVRLNFSGFVEIIDALGGIEVYSDYDFTVQNIRDYHKGWNQLNGLEALAFARERYSFPDGDYQRARNQAEVIRAVIQKCASPAILKNYRSVMEAVSGSFETNMPEDQITELAAMQLFENPSWEISSFTVDGASAYRPTFSMPGQDLYVILPKQESINQAKDRINTLLYSAS
ncbi:MAG: LCP family protein [Candidatus Merdivicinus sp.]|jgi:LCP family protein required for cell wall assembly